MPEVYDAPLFDLDGPEVPTQPDPPREYARMPHAPIAVTADWNAAAERAGGAVRARAEVGPEALLPLARRQVQAPDRARREARVRRPLERPSGGGEVSEILILDGFCCDGGSAEGFLRAAAAAGVSVHIVGVDIVERPNYRGHEIVRGDAVDFIRKHGREFHFVNVSPPCQKKCALTVGTNESQGWGREHVDLVAPTREAILSTGRPYVLEQPNGRAEIRKDVKLCGEMFGLGVLRHRNFELGGWTTRNPTHIKHRGYVRGWRHGVYRDGPYVAAYGDGGGKATVPEMQAAMGIDWTDDPEALREAIPPAYTKFIGQRLLEHLVGAR